MAIGAGSSATGKCSSAINSLLGHLSYPLYITHFPLIYLQMAWADSHKDLPVSTHIFVAIGIFILALLIAYTALKLYDLPVRKWLRKKCF